MRRVAVLGAGSWGTALAVHLGRIGHDVRLWARDPACAGTIASDRVNAGYLPDVTLPRAVSVTHDLGRALAGCEIVVCAIPSHGCRTVMRAAGACMGPATIAVSATKGLEGGTYLRMSDVMREELGERRPIVVLSGPSFATEVARELPTAVVAASSNADAIERILEDFRAPTFRLYGSSDVAGVEIGGAMKNVIAIAAGVVEGCGLGHNALAALITRGLAEVTRLAIAAGGSRETTAGLSGLGDLVLTCTSGPSRNRFVGIELGRGRPIAEILSGMKMVAEGVRTTAAAIALGERHGVELPIATQVGAVLSGASDVRAAIETLMLRRQRAEVDSLA